MTDEVKVDFAYVREIFESQEERTHFLMLMHAEFQEAIEHICFAIREENLYALRKTLHNVNTHLEMLGATELQSFLTDAKNGISGGQPDSIWKEDTAKKVKSYFNSLLLVLSREIK